MNYKRVNFDSHPLGFKITINNIPVDMRMFIRDTKRHTTKKITIISRASIVQKYADTFTKEGAFLENKEIAVKVLSIMHLFDDDAKCDFTSKALIHFDDFSF